ncbi:MAG TPA: YfaZ family outer membrane protein [Verrucomicrobiae bacterium]|nr:YfaZ family outer membrane protein [Verrucomicrobiae bacterium]
MKRFAAAVAMTLAASGARAEGIDINLSDQALRAAYAGSLTDLFPRVGGQWDAGVLLGEEEQRNFTGVHAGMLVTGDAGAARANVVAGLGGRLAFVLTDAPTAGDVNGGALALGGSIDARLPAFNRLGFIAYVYGAPNASSFGDLEGYLEYAGGIDYQVLQAASLYLGYRQLKIDVKDVGNFTVDNGWHLGLRLSF